MKISLRIFRFSRKVLIILCGVLLLGGAAGATAVYIGKDKLLGPPEEDHAGLECRAVQVITDKRERQVWMRKYIKTDAADGVTRAKTALRVAAALYEKDKPDLVQVVVLAENGPDKRAGINGHAVGADVVYVPHPEKLSDIGEVPVLQVSYVDAMANEAGEFYGTKMKMPEEEASHILASLPEKEDCADPDAELRAAAAAAAEGGEKKAEGGSEGGEGEKAKPAEGGEGEAAPAEGEAAAGEGEGKPAAEGEKPAEGGEKAEAEKGWFASVKSMVFGEDKAEAPKEGEVGPEKAAEGATEAPASGEGEAAPAEEPAPEAAAESAPAGEEGGAQKGEAAAPAGGHEAQPEASGAEGEAPAKNSHG